MFMLRVHDILNEWRGITSFSNCGMSCTDPMSSDNSGHLPCDFMPQFILLLMMVFHGIIR